MTPEQAFVVVADGLASQGWEKSWDAQGVHMPCRLRDREGRKCALGWLIPDEVYVPGMDAYEVEWPLPDIPQELVNEMRKAHDHSFSARDMWGCFRVIAEQRQFLFPHEPPKVSW